MARHDDLLGILKVKVLKGSELAIRDCGNTSDPYVVVKMGKDKVKTHVMPNTLNPVWNEDLSLPIVEPTPPIKLEVYDKDTFSIDDPMGEAEIDIQPFVEVVKCHQKGIHEGLPMTIIPSRQNCFAEASRIHHSQGTIFQDMIIRLRNVETGFLELKLQYVGTGSTRASHA